MEWIISDFSNPIFNNEFFKVINKKVRKNLLKGHIIQKGDI